MKELLKKILAIQVVDQAVRKEIGTLVLLWSQEINTQWQAGHQGKPISADELQMETIHSLPNDISQLKKLHQVLENILSKWSEGEGETTFVLANLHLNIGNKIKIVEEATQPILAIATLPELESLTTNLGPIGDQLTAKKSYEKSDEEFLGDVQKIFEQQHVSEKNKSQIIRHLAALKRTTLLADLTAWNNAITAVWKTANPDSAMENQDRISIMMDLLPDDQEQLKKLINRLASIARLIDKNAEAAQCIKNINQAVEKKLLPNNDNSPTKSADKINPVINKILDGTFPDLVRVVAVTQPLEAACKKYGDELQGIIEGELLSNDELHQTFQKNTYNFTKNLHELSFDMQSTLTAYTDKKNISYLKINQFATNNEKFKNAIERYQVLQKLQEPLQQKAPPEALSEFQEKFKQHKNKFEDSGWKKFGKVILTILSGGLAYKALWKTPRMQFTQQVSTLFSNDKKRKTEEEKQEREKQKTNGH